ncbi:MAG: peroxiredoxin family protein [Verrucomicrobiales bacterium]
MADLDKRYRSKGLQMIGAHVQNGTPEQIKKVAAKAGVKFTLTNGVSGPKSGNGIPHAVIFDPEGQVVFDGHPAKEDFEKLLKREIRGLGKSEDKPGGLAPPTTKPAPPGPGSATTAALSEAREWTNAEGKTMKAALVSVQGDIATFRRTDGKTFTYDVSKLKEDDQKLIKEKTGGGGAAK